MMDLCACVKVSVESVVESIVSTYEKHFHHSRQPNEEHALDEMIIAENRPFLYEAEGIIESAMQSYRREHSTTGKWHFLRVTNDIRLYTGCASKDVGEISRQKVEIVFYVT